jgi:phosphatidylinositol alpha-1,6-mannosyltransferase
MEPRVLLSAQLLAPGKGGICTAARMTATALAQRYQVRALACQDEVDHKLGSVSVRAFCNNRLSFVLANLFESHWATHIVYDFAGTARAHLRLPRLIRPYAVSVHGWEVWQRSPKYLQAIADATLVLVASDYTLKRAGEAIPAGIDVRVCPLGTLEDIPPVSIGPSNGAPTVMLLGRADELFAKGHDILIDVWPQVVSAVPDARLLFVGGGVALSIVRGLAAASPARAAIEIAGFVPDECLHAYWQRATVFAMLGFAEGFGLVYAEAMRRGLPVIASTDDAGQEVNIDGVTGFNIGRADKRRLAEALVALLSDYDYARTLGASGHKRWREHYAFSAFTQRFTAATADFLAT